VSNFDAKLGRDDRLSGKMLIAFDLWLERASDNYRP